MIWDLIQAQKGVVVGYILEPTTIASCGIIATYQFSLWIILFVILQNILCKQLYGSSLMLCDGATNIFPVPVYQDVSLKILYYLHENLKNVHAAWKLQFDNIIHSLKSGFYQGWDLPRSNSYPLRCILFFLSFFFQKKPLKAIEKLFRSERKTLC